MTPERKERIATLRTKLSNLSKEEKQALASKGIITTIEGRAMSINNTLLLYIQSNGTTPTVVGGYNQWKQAGRQIQRGAHGFMIWFPIGNKDKDTGNILEASKFFTGTVFDISQTELIGEPQPQPQPQPQAQPQPQPQATKKQNNDIMEGWVLV